MSVTQPADSGGTNAHQTLQVDKNMEDINHQIGSWAQLMEEEDEEQFIEVSPDEDEGTDEIDGGGAGETSSKSPEKRKRLPDEAPFRVQVTNISINHNEEELLYYFGGDQHIKRFSFQREKGRAEFEFNTRDGLLAALERDELDFQTITLRVFALRNNVGRISARHSNDYNYGSHDSHRYNSHHNQYQNQYHHHNNNRRYQNDHRGSHYNSQSSLSSDKNSRNYDNKGYRENRYSQNHYGTLPAGGYHDKRGGFSSRGGFNHYNNDRNSFRAPKNPNYERQNSGPNPHQYRDRYEGGGGGPIQRSGSYQHHRNNDYRHGPPQPISSRNRTESHSTNFDQYSRASSRMSIDEAGAPKQIQRKVSANPFGDAKPVDTSTKLLEIEKRQAEKDRIEKEAAAAAAAAAAAKQSNSNLAATGDGGNDEQQQQQQQHHHNQQHHNNHHNHHQHGDQHSSSRHSKKSSKKSTSSTSSYHHDGERRPSFDQGALPGSVIIKKRESADVDKQRDEECSTPPVDPYQYPSNQDADKQHDQPPTNALPPPPPSSNSQQHHQRSGSTKNHQQVRPSTKPYMPKGGVLQKSATVGQMENQQHENQNRKDSVGKFNRNYSGTGVRRPSFSGSDGGGGKQSSRGIITKRGGRGGGNSGNNSTRDHKSNRGKPQQQSQQQQQQQQQETKKEEVKDVEQQPAAPPPPPTPAESVVESAAKVETQNVKEEEVEKSSTTAVVAQNPATPTQKKKDKKKDKKKELSHMSSNKYAALLNCPQ